MAQVGDRYLWTFEVNEGSFHASRLGYFYAASGLTYVGGQRPKDVDPVLADSGPGRQKVMIRAEVVNAEIFDEKKETTELETRYSDTPTWEYKFVSFAFDAEATQAFRALEAATKKPEPVPTPHPPAGEQARPIGAEPPKPPEPLKPAGDEPLKPAGAAQA